MRIVTFTFTAASQVTSWKAPVSGIILELHVTNGTAVVSSNPSLTVTNLTSSQGTRTDVLALPSSAKSVFTRIPVALGETIYVTPSASGATTMVFDDFSAEIPAN